MYYCDTFHIVVDVSTEAALTLSKFSWLNWVKEKLVKVLLHRVACLYYQSNLSIANLFKKKMEICKNVVNMLLLHIKTSNYLLIILFVLMT